MRAAYQSMREVWWGRDDVTDLRTAALAGPIRICVKQGSSKNLATPPVRIDSSVRSGVAPGGVRNALPLFW
jgi:hypothetical protein